jgi:hypothetical protein
MIRKPSGKRLGLERTGKDNNLHLLTDVIQYKQEDSIANDKTGALPNADKDRRLWLGIRRGLFIMIQAIEERYDMPQTRAGK